MHICIVGSHGTPLSRHGYGQLHIHIHIHIHIHQVGSHGTPLSRHGYGQLDGLLMHICICTHAHTHMHVQYAQVRYARAQVSSMGFSPRSSRVCIYRGVHVHMQYTYMHIHMHRSARWASRPAAAAQQLPAPSLPLEDSSNMVSSALATCQRPQAPTPLHQRRVHRSHRVLARPAAIHTSAL